MSGSTQCAQCDAPLSDGARFCDQCGAVQHTACPSCGAEASASANFCAQCGSDLEAQGPPSSGSDPEAHTKERREMTVMFADLVGSTAISSGIDAEEFGEVIAQYVSTVETVISEYGGHLGRVLGDGVLAYFGYPRAQEDDARRACMAGLAVVEAVEQLDISPTGLGPINPTARVGIHTGTALLDVVGTEHREVMAMGESLNLAARLQTLAEAGSVVISAATHALVDEQFQFADLGEEQLRGIGGTTHVYRLQRSRRTAEIVESPSRAALPLIGREPELDLIMRRWGETVEGHGRIVVLAGEAGLGKSRIVRELRARIEGEIRWVHARGTSFTVDTALHPIREILPDLLGLSRRPVVQELSAALSELMIDGDEPTALAADLVGLGDDPTVPQLGLSPQIARQRTLELLTEILIRASAKAPLVIVLESSQWLDSSTLELLDLLAPRIRDSAVMLIVSGRDPIEAQWSPDSTVVLNPLGGDQASEFVRELDDEARLSPEMVDAIVTRGDGNPMYMAQVTQMVLAGSDARGADVLADVPPTLHELLLARLDGVGRSRKIVQLAAAIGRTFPYGLLEAVIEGMDGRRLSEELAARVTAGHLWVRGHGEEARYTFKHGLLRDAAEQSMTRSMRAKVNARIADAMIQRGDHPPEVVATHLELGRRNLESAVYWTMAGQESVRRFALVEAMSQLERGLALLENAGKGEQARMAEIDLRTTYGFPLMLTTGFGSEATATNYQALLEACEGADKSAPELLFPALWGLWTFYEVASRLPEAEDAGRRLLKLGADTGRPDIELAGHCAFGTSKLMRGGLADARRHYEAGIELYDPEAHAELALTMGQDGGAMMLSFLTWVYAHTGEKDRLEHYARKSIELCERLGQPSSWAFAHAVLASAFCIVEDWDRAAEHSERTIELGRDQGMPPWDAQGRCNLAWALSTSEPDRAVELAAEGLAFMDELGSKAATTYFAVAPILAELERGDTAAAERAVEDLTERIERTGETYFVTERMRLQAAVEVRKGASEEAERLLEEAVEAAARQGAAGLEAKAQADLDALRSGGAIGLPG